MRVSSSPAPTITPRPVTGSPSATRSRRHLPIEFRGYVPEDDIPELFQTTSVLVLPYDSATGSSGPAHQACQFGVPIVSADLPDFRGMAADEEMAIRFYQRGDPRDLAGQLLAILESPMLERQMAEHNFAAGIEMTMTSVVNNYLRWFRVNRSRRAIRSRRAQPELPSEACTFGEAAHRLHCTSNLPCVPQRSERRNELRALRTCAGPCRCSRLRR